ncbi:MAG: hypothetical protein JWQ32_3567 [Marmoricola sp.]|nr:hypothetical protein [Marmoricola sp.]
MALKILRADPFTRSELGRRGMEELSRNLWLGKCQSCGSGLGTDVPAVVIIDDGLPDESACRRSCHRSGFRRQPRSCLQPQCGGLLLSPKHPD